MEGRQTLIDISGRSFCLHVDMYGDVIQQGWREISGSFERDSGLDQGGGGRDGEQRVCLEVEQTGLAGVEGEGEKNLG